jgi:hypothetical protein
MKTTTKEARQNIRQYILDHFDPCGYYYNRSAVDDLGAILEQSEREKAQYSEAEAENLLTHLIYRELKRGAGK